MIIIDIVPPQTVKAPPLPPPTVVGVWNSDCVSSNITSSNPNCVSVTPLTPGNTFTVDVNITNAPNFNAFETALFYDPTNITVASYDYQTGTIFSQPFLVRVHNSTGAFRINVVNLGSQHFQGNGVLFHITFRIDGFGASPLVVAASNPDPGQDAQGADGNVPNWTRLIVTTATTNPVETNVTTADGYFRNVIGPTRLPPLASFTFEPSSLAAQEPVTFDATASRDPDKPITQPGPGIKGSGYVWDFGAVTSIGTRGFVGPLMQTSYLRSGNYTVLLTVTDNDTSYQAMKSISLRVSLQPFHALEINGISLNGAPQTLLNPNDTLHIVVTVLNGGTFEEHFNLTISWGPPTTLIAPAFYDQSILPGTSRSRRAYNATLLTAGLALGTYEIDVALVDHPVNSTALDQVVKAIFTIAQPSSVPWVPIVGGIFAIIAVPTAVVVIRRRMRVEAE